MPKQTNKMTEYTEKSQFNAVLCTFIYFVDMWRTLPPFDLQTVLQGPYSPLRTAFLFRYKKVHISELVFLPH